MTVHFIGAGPGAPDLLTLRGRDLIAACPVCLYAGSLVPGASWRIARPGRGSSTPRRCRSMRSSRRSPPPMPMARTLRGCIPVISIWSAMGEQLRRLRTLDIPYTVTPGVPSFSAAAAALEAELTLPGLAQTVVLTRTPGRASAMPEGEACRLRRHRRGARHPSVDSSARQGRR